MSIETMLGSSNAPSLPDGVRIIAAANQDQATSITTTVRYDGRWPTKTEKKSWNPGPLTRADYDSKWDQTPVTGSVLSDLAKTLTAMMQFWEMFDIMGQVSISVLEAALRHSKEREDTPEKVFLAAKEAFAAEAEDNFGNNLFVDTYCMKLGRETGDVLQSFVEVMCFNDALTYDVVKEAANFSKMYHQFREVAVTWEAARIEELAQTNGDSDLIDEILKGYEKRGLRPVWDAH